MALPAEAVGREGGLPAVVGQGLLLDGILRQVGVEHHGVPVGRPLGIQVGGFLAAAQVGDLGAVLVALALAVFQSGPGLEGVAGLFEGVFLQGLSGAVVELLRLGLIAVVEHHGVWVTYPLGVEGHGTIVGGSQVLDLRQVIVGLARAVSLGVPAREAVVGTPEGIPIQGHGLAVDKAGLIRHLAGALVGVEPDLIGDGGPLGSKLHDVLILRIFEDELLSGVDDAISQLPPGEDIARTGVAALGDGIGLSGGKLRHVLDGALGALGSGGKTCSVGVGRPEGIEGHFRPVFHGQVCNLLAVGELDLPVCRPGPAHKVVAGTMEGVFPQTPGASHRNSRGLHGAVAAIGVISNGVEGGAAGHIVQGCVVFSNFYGFPLFSGAQIEDLGQVGAVVKAACPDLLHTGGNHHGGEAGRIKAVAGQLRQAFGKGQLSGQVGTPGEGAHADLLHAVRQNNIPSQGGAAGEGIGSDTLQLLRQDQLSGQFGTGAESVPANACQAQGELHAFQRRTPIEGVVANMGNALLHYQLPVAKSGPGSLLPIGREVRHFPAARDGQGVGIVQGPDQAVAKSAGNRFGLLAEAGRQGQQRIVSVLYPHELPL